jgi:hypothetical protein
MTDPEIIDKAYEDTIQQIYSVLYSALLIPQDANRREEAERRFQVGIRRAREIRDRAKQLLP